MHRTALKREHNEREKHHFEPSSPQHMMQQAGHAPSRHHGGNHGRAWLSLQKTTNTEMHNICKLHLGCTDASKAGAFNSCQHQLQAMAWCTSVCVPKVTSCA